ncbi:MAG: hypothetical protein ACLPYM_02015 [Limisphaerales bacterium]
MYFVVKNPCLDFAAFPPSPIFLRDKLRLENFACSAFFAVFEDEDEPSPSNFAAPRNEDEEE